ncbi:hypothetical protein TNIN_417631 [Trichonephila inaurata madagascariensis]|uniref:Secreted protein n=1 Tax=Trichonephila inaurata madagascariensis TaxID=2747483 RepID=A0A8X6MKU4_9ARAC|nr:hypothetical protein TNIN_417631 [Trichonephila inaurata madagascariensis]
MCAASGKRSGRLCRNLLAFLASAELLFYAEILTPITPSGVVDFRLPAYQEFTFNRHANNSPQTPTRFGHISASIRLRSDEIYIGTAK